MSNMQFGTTTETVITREEFPLNRAKKIMQNETIAILGYGVQGPAQAMNLRDQGFNVIIGQRPNSPSWDKAQADGFLAGETLFDLSEASAKASILCYLLSDAGQIQCWEQIKPHLTKGKTLCFSHGFAITYANQTGIQPPSDIDVILIAPKGSGRSVRQLFLKQQGINASYAIHQDATLQAEDKALALGIGVGAGYLFKTTFSNEVYSDLVGERGALMGALAGIIEAQYQVLRAHGHSPSEAFNETVEELTQSLVPLVSEHGMDWMFSHCSTTAQRGALDWAPRFKSAVLPLFESLYQQVASGEEAARVIAANSDPNYRAQLMQELDHLGNQEIWQAGKTVRSLRPKTPSNSCAASWLQ